MNTEHYRIPAGRELRVECSKNDPIKITLNHGGIEINGCQIRDKQTIVNRNFALFAWFDSEVTLEGRCKGAYVSNESLTPLYLDIHKQLQTERNNVHPYNSRTAPRVLILSNPNHGKYTLAQTLLSYAVRFNESPVYLDLDIASGNITVPGCMSAVVVNKESILTPRVQKFLPSPRVEFYGFQSCMDNPELFKRCLHSIAADVETRMKNDEKAFHGGLIVNGGSWYKEDGSRPLLDEVIELLKIDLILVIHDDFIYNVLRDSYPSLCVKQLPLSKGVVTPMGADDLENRLSIDNYFYGYIATDGELAVASQLVRSLDEVKVVMYNDRVSVSHRDTFAPKAAEEEVMMKVSEVGAEELYHQILAVTDAKEVKDLPTSSILGFVFVSSVNVNDRVIRLVTPLGGDLPGNILLKGKITWNEK
ncbi:hypothetical protein JH06_1371 [Blastocystis sp. subtype 4]|uniref:hypothetical protein n=1 Tax=Blastocystis sp. subtype 4 TaxID=944170 RepID=UPI000711B39E|nr:hypothetical protein JH06_1371 [Blastocystis sp. subtype 4]KNB45767.1 hypothetical protein JH06_1371 [Blastocystis sp. subtype 4]|eukprot:XP_014529210.1 hypothetical protein JH06_1371 [Blastocystis sp. subtype 4]